VVQLPAMAEMTDEEIDAWADEMWEKVVKPMKERYEAQQRDKA